MVSWLQDMPGQWWYKAQGNSQSLSYLTKGPLNEIEPISNNSWVTKNLRLDRPET